MSSNDDEKALEEVEGSPDAQELLEQYQAFSEKLHDFNERRLEALKKVEEVDEHEKVHARHDFFEHHVAALEASGEHLEAHQALEEAIEEDLHALAEKREVLERILEEQAEEAQEENRHAYRHQLNELLEFLKEKQAHYEHMFGSHHGLGVSHAFGLTPGGGHEHGE